MKTVLAGLLGLCLFVTVVISGGGSGDDSAGAVGCGGSSPVGSGGPSGTGTVVTLPPAGSPRQNSLSNPALSIPAQYQAYYVAAGRAYGLPWGLLAGIGMEETGHGRNIAVSSAGALGPMQFMPATWAKVSVLAPGHTGVPNIMDPGDAIYSAAHYLVMSGAKSNGAAGVRAAILAYNHADWYVNDVLYYANGYETGGAGVGGGCSTGDGSVQALDDLVRTYAWPDPGSDGRLNQMSGYAAAVATAKATKHFYGEMSNEIPANRPQGDHCSAFVSLLMTNSGWDRTYNYSGLTAQGAGFVPTQQAWLAAHWKALGNASTLSVSQLRPGDVGISVNLIGLTHVWVYVGSVPGFNGNYAEASYVYGSFLGFAPQARQSNSVLYASSGTAYYYRRP